MRNCDQISLNHRHHRLYIRCILNSEKLNWEKMGIMESMKDTNAKFLNTPETKQNDPWSVAT